MLWLWNTKTCSANIQTQTRNGTLNKNKKILLSTKHKRTTYSQKSSIFQNKIRIQDSKYLQHPSLKII